MDHVVISVEGLAEDPEVILVWQPIVDANLLIRAFKRDVNDHIGAGKLDPALDVALRLNHNLYIGRSSTATSVEHSILFNESLIFEHEFEETSLDARWDQVI